MIDFIGDVHGHADKLKELLVKMGYQYRNGTYSHPERKIIFVGDYIDRGPKIKETLEIVKGMVDSQNATALMGNHEYNALCFHFQEREGGHLRKHLIKNIIQHYETLKQFQNNQLEYESYLEWFKTLPLFYETDGFRAVHSCWDTHSINTLRKHLDHDRLTDDLIYQSAALGTPLNRAVEMVLKGKEIHIPEGVHFIDKDGTHRQEMRIKWWEDPAHSTYKSICIEPIAGLPDLPLKLGHRANAEYYKEENKPVFFGHYWLKGNPVLYRNNICCLDYSVAKNGYLTAYRYHGETRLDNSKLVYV
jgi:hypothetical protein